MTTPIGEFDYIIVGAGSAGCVLANRLSAEPSKRVLLLEAGGKDSNPLIKMPIGFTRLMYSARESNLYKTEPEASLDGRRLSVPRGRLLGGSSSINGMVYTRGQREDYDDWAALPGCEGWSYKDLLPYFKRSERFMGGEASDYHGTDGELAVTYLSMRYPITEAYIDAAVSIGIPRNDDLNGARQEGIGYAQVNQKDGKRWSAADAFLGPEVKRRENLIITTHAWARRILITDRRATGVEFEDAKGRVHQALARGEVLLAAGAYNSPPLLELSGIGQREVIESLGVTPVHELVGVGQNLQDHFQLWVQHGVQTRKTLGEDGKFPRVVWNTLRYLVTKKGPLSFAAANVNAFVRREGDSRPIFQIHFTPGAGGVDDDGNMVSSKQSGVNSTVCVVRPTSRGDVHAVAHDPKTAPRIVHNYLSTEDDIALSIEGFRLQRRIYAAEPFQKHATEEIRPGSAVQTDDEILAFWKSEGMSLYHPVGSAKMGSASDPEAVVDHELRVHGIGALRVVDASVFPLLPSGNTHAPVVAVAERAADLVRRSNP